MKHRFFTIDLMSILPELNEKLVGMRVTQVYDVDHKTYLFKLGRTAAENKGNEPVSHMLLIESGIRIHSTEYQWPKGQNPSGFTMKLRKHLKNKRLQCIRQLGVDRVVDLQFGSNEAAYHVILELYDRGNIVITDHQFIILNILRPRKAGSDEDVKLVVKERYPIEAAVKEFAPINRQVLEGIVNEAKDGDNLKKVLTPCFNYGPALIEHALIEMGLNISSKVNKESFDYEKVEAALKFAHQTLVNAGKSRIGFILQKVEQRIGEPNAHVVTFLEFHPVLYNQHKKHKDPKVTFVEVDSFDKAVDMFFSSIEGQKIDSKALQLEKEAMKKLDNIKRDHEKRIEDLEKAQESDIQKANLIEVNSHLVDKALFVIRNAIANQFSWSDIQEMIKEAQAKKDPIACLITSLKLDKNHFTMKLSNEYEDEPISHLVDIDIDLSSYANARKYYDMKRTAAKKEQKTIESSAKAYKNAEKKAMQTLKEVAVKTAITKARKIFWFEKFLWFISSENYLVIAGHDAQQNELIVKRYMKPTDLYVHADLHGATSVIIKNSNPSLPIPPKTLTEAGDMAISYSAAWDAKIVSSAWWVYPHQVSKTAPSGEYLTVGSFMIRGKKNYLPLSHLVLGFGFLFKLDEESIERHKNDETRRRNASFISSSESGSVGVQDESMEDVDIDIPVDSDSQSGDEAQFPDTQPKTAIDLIETQQESDKIYIEDNSNSIIITSKEPRKKQIQKHKQQNSSQQKNINNKTADKQLTNKPEEQVIESNKSQQLKRGQRSRLKKMKEKYKNQDEEERQLRMSILGRKNDTKNKSNDNNPVRKQPDRVIRKQETHKSDNKEINESLSELNLKENKVESKASTELNDTQKDFDENEGEANNEQQQHQQDDDDDEDAPAVQSEDVKIIESLCGRPLLEDNLLFSIPVCAPYSAMQSYKYKVKVLPGMNRRGKAAKTALQLFIRDKTATEREKDVLKTVKDLDISKNLPSKIKIAASNLQSVKGKK